MIWVMGMLPVNQGAESERIDVLGWGLIGTKGLIVYLLGLLGIGAGVLLVVEAIRRNRSWTDSLQLWILKIPAIGPALKTLMLTRFTWALHLVLDTEMDLRQALPLALETTGNRYYQRHAGDIVSGIAHGQDFHAALAATKIFPSDLLDAIATGEQSGQLVEQMGRLSETLKMPGSFWEAR